MPDGIGITSPGRFATGPWKKGLCPIGGAADAGAVDAGAAVCVAVAGFGGWGAKGLLAGPSGAAGTGTEDFTPEPEKPAMPASVSALTGTPGCTGTGTGTGANGEDGATGGREARGTGVVSVWADSIDPS